MIKLNIGMNLFLVEGSLLLMDINILVTTWASKVGTNTTKNKIYMPIGPYTYNKNKNKNCVYFTKTNKTLCDIHQRHAMLYYLN